MQFTVTTEHETQEVARKLTEQFFRGGLLIFLLHGEMGAGKTRFAQGIGKALGISSIMPSPTFVLTREYPFQNGLFVHIDCWRTPTITPSEIGLEDYMHEGAVVAIEWPTPLEEFVSQVQAATVVAVTISGDSDTRVITVK